MVIATVVWHNFNKALATNFLWSLCTGLVTKVIAVYVSFCIGQITKVLFILAWNLNFKLIAAECLLTHVLMILVHMLSLGCC
uniref:Uncharacterized protein n=1 Tax=Rhizophora mucronata TaxID=61149 RepID=A0A2P2N2T6_RHIMU